MKKWSEKSADEIVADVRRLAQELRDTPIRSTPVVVPEAALHDISKSESTRRVTISIPESFLFALEKIAIRSKSSVAWVVRSALEKYLKDNENEK